jgi:hypothetical protein
MANDRISQIEARFQARSDARDDQISHLSTLISRVTESASANSAELSRCRDALEGLRDRQPGPIQLWGPVLLTVSMVAGALVFVMNEGKKPIEAEIAQQKQFNADVKGVNSIIAERQWQMNSELQYQKGILEATREQLNDVDKLGSRRWTRK